MQDTATYQTEVKEFKGGTTFINIPLPIRNLLGITKFSVVDVNLKVRHDKKIKFLCKRCNNEFISSNENLICASCGTNNVEDFKAVEVVDA